MPGFDRVLDPLTGDYVDADGGEYEETLTIATALYHQMRTEKDRWWGDRCGSDLYRAKYQGAGIVGVRFVDNALREALQPFINDGLAADPQIEIDADERGRIVVEATITDIQYGEIDVGALAPIGEV